MSNKRPWFKFFPADWLGSRMTRFLSPEERGCLIQLLAEAWMSEPCGSLPADPEELWRLAGAKSKKEFAAHSNAVLQSFTLVGGRYWNQELVSLYGDITAISAERRIAGTLGARKKWQSDGKPMANASDKRWQTDGDLDIEETRKEKDLDSDGKVRTEDKENGGALPLGSVPGLAPPVFKANEMPRPMSKAQLRRRKNELQEQAKALQTLIGGVQ